MLTQDDLLFLHHFRALTSSHEAERQASKDALAFEPGRAAGRVASWSLERSGEFLRRFGRRPLVLSARIVPSALETRLVEVVRALKAHDRSRAAQAALWLVPERHVAGLLDRLAPLIIFYPSDVVAAERQAANA
ncbi:MAG: hypothetical protein AAGA39_09215 [Pseudomonadota bacterium]